MSAAVNRVVLVGNLTRDPDLRELASGDNVCHLRVATSTRRRGQDGDWEEKPNYFDVSVFGPSAEACDSYLTKGRPVAVDGRLDWREWTAQDGQHREAVGIIADSVQFLGGRPDGEGIAAGVADEPAF